MSDISPSDKPFARCVKCGASFTEAELAGATACPSCGSKGVPCDPAKDVTISVNVHELRILGIWAENWAVQCDNAHLDDVNHESMKDTVAAICGRIRKQLGEAGKDSPLTLSEEFRQIQKEYPTAEFFRDGKEEIVE